MLNLCELYKYDLIVMWGAGYDALWYENQFKLDYFVDRDSKKWGNRIKGVEVKCVDVLIDDDSSGKSILVIISSSRYRNDIYKEINKLVLRADVTELSIMRAMYSYENVSYALWGVDILIKDILTRGGYDISKMFYMEVGACHPILGSKTYNASLHGAKGILIEPNPDLYSELKKYRNDECLMEGVAAERGSLLYYKFNNEFRNTFDKLVAEDALKKGFVLLETQKLPVETIGNVIDKYKVDTQNTFLSIQIMGTELELLKTFEYKKYKFPLIVLSIHSNEIYEYEIFKDYNLIAQVPYHVVLVNDEIYRRIHG